MKSRTSATSDCLSNPTKRIPIPRRASPDSPGRSSRTTSARAAISSLASSIPKRTSSCVPSGRKNVLWRNAPLTLTFSEKNVALNRGLFSVPMRVSTRSRTLARGKPRCSSPSGPSSARFASGRCLSRGSSTRCTATVGAMRLTIHASWNPQETRTGSARFISPCPPPSSVETRMLGTFLKPECEELIQKKDWTALREVFSELDPPDIAEIIEDLPTEDSGIIFRLLPRDIAAAVFEYLPLEQQGELVNTLGKETLVNVLNEMAPDDRTRLFEELPAEVTRRVLANLNPEELGVARQLLGYPENTAGRRMTPEYLAVRPTMTAAEALAFVREHGKDRETLNVIFITDERGHLLGDVRLASLVLSPPSAQVGGLEER